ncbi:hypothetical protein ATY41_02085 [Leifsonia xyli subsp. xyli]|uniref:Teneurin-like YD-shell domain-containing protein n=1 Tax=Leifsonia xyli subsp. xyli TaxID=59736 RepID=A0A1E2SL66_LEIXY|nr:hypothetical protein ATY41_02085 [Leifsonia xyli subsp. xyli]
MFGLIRYDYDADGRLTGANTGDLVQSWEYRDGFPVRHSRVDADGVTDTAIDRDDEGRVRGIARPEGRTAYAYDDACQLVSASTTATDGAVSASAWAYDPAGRLVDEVRDGAHRRHRYDAAGQLLETVDGVDRAVYTYNGSGRRVSATVGGERTVYEWGATGRLSSVTRHAVEGETRTALWVDALGELAEVDGVALAWDTAAGIPDLLGVDDQPVVNAPGGMTGTGSTWNAQTWRPARSTAADDPWEALARVSDAAGVSSGLSILVDGSVTVAGLEWMGARAYDPVTRGFLSVDPLAPPVGAGWSGNPYSFAGNDAVHAVDPLGLAPITDAELKGYADSLQGPLARAAGAAGNWLKDNWEYVAGGAMVVAGGILMATGVGGPVGLMLIGAGADTIIQKATTGEVNWGPVAMGAAFGMVPGGAIVGKLGGHLLGNAVEGAVEGVADYSVSGEPLTVSGVLRVAGTSAAISAGTGEGGGADTARCVGEHRRRCGCLDPSW